jgi:hypothetical protein
MYSGPHMRTHEEEEPYLDVSRATHDDERLDTHSVDNIRQVFVLGQLR